MAKIEKTVFDLPIFLLTKATQCPYINSRIEKRLATDISNNSHLHDELSLSGFRRVENWMYRPACDNCSECKAYRIKVKEFKCSKSFKRVLNLNSNIKIDILPNKGTKEHFALFEKYQKSRHIGGSMSLMNYEEFKSMIEISPINSNLIEFREHKNNLIGVMLFDKQKDGLSAVYSFFNPKRKKNGIGNFMILELINQTKSINLNYVYLGYYIKNVVGMDYKKRFTPAQIYQDGKWVEIK